VSPQQSPGALESVRSALSGSGGWAQALVVLLTCIAALWLGGMLWSLGVQFGDVLLPFFLAWLLAFALNPVAEALQRLRLPRGGAVAVVYVALLSILSIAGVLIVPSIAGQAILLGAILPSYAERLPGLLGGLDQALLDRGITVPISSVLTAEALAQRAEGLGAALATSALGFAGGLANAVVTGILVLILSVFFMLDGGRILGVLLDALPVRYQDEARYFVAAVNRTFGGYIRGLVIQAVLYGVGTYLVMSLLGLPFAAVIAVFAGFILIIPFLGSLVAVLPPISLALFTGNAFTIIATAVALILLQQLVLNVIMPKILSDNVGLHPLLVFAAILLGAKAAGGWGAIFGVPIMGVVWSMVVLAVQQRRAALERAAAEAGGSE
jgi:predicted PurR-regulated permease PerM